MLMHHPGYMIDKSCSIFSRPY